MTIRSLLAGEVFTPLERLDRALIRIEHGKIAAIEPAAEGAADLALHEVIDASDGIVIPGLVDLQVNGALGWSFQAEHSGHYQETAGYHLKAGTTTFLPTLVTAPDSVLLESLERLSGFVAACQAPFLPGIHLEGPFLSTEKRGAHDPQYLRLPDLDLMKKFSATAGARLRMVTLAPELEGAEPVIRYAVERGMIVSAGHSAAGYKDMQRALEAGLSLVTHAGNASDWPHRAMGDLGFLASEPGVVGALMADDRLSGGVIMDGFHFHPALLPPLLRLKGPDRLLLVSDASSVAGCLPGVYDSGGLEVTVHPEGFASSGRGGGWLAGSTITLLQAVQRAVALAKIPLQTAVHMASLGPARLLGIDGIKGQIKSGSDADLMVLNRDLSLRQVIFKGKLVFEADSPGNP